MANPKSRKSRNKAEGASNGVEKTSRATQKSSTPSKATQESTKKAGEKMASRSNRTKSKDDSGSGGRRGGSERRGGGGGGNGTLLPPSSSSPSGKKIIMMLILLLVGLFLVGYVLIWQWMLSRVYVGPGQMLVIKANTGKPNPNPSWYQVVPKGFKGIQEAPVGEGRHFYNPFLYKRTLHRKIIQIGPQEVGLVISRSGKPLPEGQFLADKGFKGVMRQPLTPGKWRLNPIAFQVKKRPAVNIRPGYVGVVMALDKDPKTGKKGILKDVLQPGLYYINPKAFRVEEVEIGFRHINLDNMKFKSLDSFNIELDVSVVWGLKPKNAPHIIKTLGNIREIVAKVIRPQVNTIVRLEGSRHQAREFIEGKTREAFQDRVTKRLKAICNEKKIEILISLVRNIEIPKEVRDPINQSKIAVEERKTKVEMKKTQKIRNKLASLKADVTKGIREVRAGTAKVIAEIKADGQRKVLRIKGEKEVKVAEIMRKVAEIEAQIDLVKGKAVADVIAMLKKAKSDEFFQFAKALGSGKTLANYIFTKKLSKNLKVMLRYAGPGTFWTDMSKGMMQQAANGKILQGKK